MNEKEKAIREGTCIYCGAFGPVTNDHVPPRSLFPKGTEGLIVVPACEACNNGAKLDDELAVHLLSMSHDPETIPGDRTLDRMKRKVESGRPALLYKIASLGRRVRISPPEGERDAVMIYTTAEEGGRVVRVLQRYARGIVFHETGVPLPPATSIRVAKLPPIQAASAADRTLNGESFQPLLSAVDVAPERRIGGDVFMYKVRPVTEGGAVLYFCFNGAVEFLLIAEAP